MGVPHCNCRDIDGSPTYTVNLNTVLIYFGGQNLSETPDIIIEYPPYWAGRNLADLGDINNDGIADFAVSSPFNDKGKVYIHFGVDHSEINSAEKIAAYDVVLEQDTTNFKSFGLGIDGGDFNGDGHNDVAVKSSRDLSGGPQFVFIYFGGSDFDNKVDLLLEIDMEALKSDLEESTKPYTLGELTFVPDINGDGSEEILIGSYRGSRPRITNALLYLGSDSPNLEPAIVFVAPNQWIGMGVSLMSFEGHSAIGDFTGNGTIDFIIGQRYDNNDGPNTSRVYRYVVPSDLVKIQDNSNERHPKQFVLKQNYPNPFNPTTNIYYSLPKQDYIRLDIYNVVGEKIKTLVNSIMGIGNHLVVWNGRDELSNQVSSGIYFCEMKTSTSQKTIKMLFLK